MAFEPLALVNAFEVSPGAADTASRAWGRLRPVWSDVRPLRRRVPQWDQRPPGSGSSLTIAVGRALGTVVVTLRGELGDHDAPRLEAVLADLIVNQGNLDVVVDLRRLAAASPAGLAALGAAATWADERGATFRLSQASAPFRETLAAAGLPHAV
jgi:anti-anti-sigma factor